MYFWEKLSRGWRFISKTFMIFALWGFALFVVFQLRAVSLDFNVPHLKRKLPEIHGNSTTNVTDVYHIAHLSLSEDQLIVDIQKRMPNLPVVFWNKNKNKLMRFNKSCARFPNLLDQDYNNLYWQTLQTTNGTFQLFGAYLDVRPKNRLGPSVRILGMINRIEPTVHSYCQLWFSGNKKPVFVKTLEYSYIWNKTWSNHKQKIYQPYLITCVLPTQYKRKIPQSVSLVEKPCHHAANNLRVIYEKPRRPKKDFAVCVKGMDFLHEDLSVRLVEWLELLDLLGADMVYTYVLQIHPNISKVLKHYEKKGKITQTPITLAGPQPNAPSFQHFYLKKKLHHKRQSELIPYNDCFYKHMYKYKYIALLDIDEVIMPMKGITWKDLMKTVLPKALKMTRNQAASYSVRNVYFLDNLLHNHGWFKDIPKFMHMLQHAYRSKIFTKPGEYVKCFHDTEKVLTLHNHYPFACVNGPCTHYAIQTKDAQLQHYRADCVKELKNKCKEFTKASVMDTTIWKFKETLIHKVSNTLKTLGFISNENNNETK